MTSESKKAKQAKNAADRGKSKEARGKPAQGSSEQRNAKRVTSKTHNDGRGQSGQQSKR
jgi:hypothetical protein